METNDRILLALGDLREDIGRLGADVKHVVRRADEMSANLAAHTDEDHEVEGRVRSLEKSRSHLGGIVAGVSAVTTLVVSAAAYALQHFPLK